MRDETCSLDRNPDENVRVLLIESDESCVESVKNVLEKHTTNFVIDLATTLKEGLYKLEACAGHDDPIYDVILLDLILPNGKGLKAFEQVQKQCKRLPVVILSRHEDKAAECVKRGAQDYILRPDQLTMLGRSLDYSIERFRVERRYKQLVECTNAAIYEVDFVNHRFTYVNDKLCEFSGYTRDELLKMGPTELLTEESRQLFNKRLRKLHRGDFIPNTAEFQVRTKDGSLRWALITADYISHGTIVVGARVIALDITKQRNLEYELDKIVNEKITNWKEEISPLQNQLSVLDSIIMGHTNG